jgi:Co/Zn/Cd efflux system component
VAHLRKPLAAAVGLNTAVLAVEGVGGFGANSLSLLTDAVHNLSDETALVFLLLAYLLRAGVSGQLLRAANLLNSVGLLAISLLLVWQAVERLLHPAPVLTVVPIIAGLIGALGNWGVAKALEEASRYDAAIRLAYVHNLGDALLSLAPVAAGALILITGRMVFDPLVAIVVAGVIIGSTLHAIAASRRELLWPRRVVCGHPESPQRSTI